MAAPRAKTSNPDKPSSIPNGIGLSAQSDAEEVKQQAAGKCKMLTEHIDRLEEELQAARVGLRHWSRLYDAMNDNADVGIKYGG